MQPTQTTKHSIAELNGLYTESESVDADIFAEQRSNILLYSGDHYTKKSSRFNTRLRDIKDINQEQKLRLTKNHTQYICDSYVNNIIGVNPGVGFTAKNEKEVHDQKVAQLHHAVWRDAHERYDIDEKIDDWAESFIQIGEVCLKIYFDPMKGPIKAYPQKTDDQENPLFNHPTDGETTNSTDEMGNPLEAAPDQENAIHQGEFCFEEIYGFNLLRPAECKDIRLAEWLGVRKMVSDKEIKARFPGQEKKINTSSDKTYIVFDTARGGYTQVRNQVLLVEYFFRPCDQYENGYFYITTKDGVLAEGELPGGIFPIVFQAFRKFPTTPRGRSPIKTMRPYQAEINRSASKIAEHQITLGDDKLLIMNNTKISAGVALPGVRSINYNGQAPTVLQGRSGEQYVGYMQGQIEEMYRVMGVGEDMEELPAQLDAYTMLFRSARQKKKFQRYIKRFSRFLINVVKLYLKLFKLHATDDTLVHAIGSTERVNIPEFREMPELYYEVNIEDQSEDIETKLGKQLSIAHVLQYVGPQMDKQQIGKMIKQMPYGNLEESFEDTTLEYDNSVNDILALDRGQTPPINQYEDHPYQIGRLTNRMKKSDFQFLPPPVQQNYAMKVNMHQQFEAQKQMAIQRASQGMVPTGGYLAKVDLYVPDAKDPNKSNRVTLPSESIQWLIKQIESQQAGLAPLAALPVAAQAGIADKFSQMRNAGARPGPLSMSPQGAINNADRPTG